MRPARWLWLVLVAGCVAVADSPSPTDPNGVTTSSSTSTTIVQTDVEVGVAAFSDCMAGLGVVLDDIPLDSMGRPTLQSVLRELDPSDAQFVTAITACASTLSVGALDTDGDPKMAALVTRRLEELSECIRDRGVVGFPDPRPDFSGVGPAYRTDLIPWADPGLPAAADWCTERLIDR
jgi:hypothetical protein